MALKLQCEDNFDMSPGLVPGFWVVSTPQTSTWSAALAPLLLKGRGRLHGSPQRCLLIFPGLMATWRPPCSCPCSSLLVSCDSVLSKHGQELPNIFLSKFFNCKSKYRVFQLPVLQPNLSSHQTRSRPLKNAQKACSYDGLFFPTERSEVFVHATTWMRLKHTTLSERSHKRSHSVWAYWYEISRIGKSIETGARGRGGWGFVRGKGLFEEDETCGIR